LRSSRAAAMKVRKMPPPHVLKHVVRSRPGG